MGRSNIRVTLTGVGGSNAAAGYSRRRQPGTKTAIEVNAFGLQALQGITGEEIAEILMYALEPAKMHAIEEWPKLTHASVETIDLEVTEVGPKMARVALVAGGERLVNDPRNKSKKDYAPFIEFNGTSTTPPGTLTSAVILTEEQRRQRLREGLAALIERKLQ